ncbi:hypothetical protein B0I35DRAFT_195163 [Stachybotrys elegans]|uniref:Uncharacterized protein n=1 Tax=Stachybotrys elegans TaxID=80388 RepID=A0A8K0WK79_9HYPO|nr:hypothetical protein B0I35DRAFT_195163 [Stachybotrys elegans]
MQPRSMASIALQWSLDQTSDHLVETLHGYLRAASSDNIQALAIVACEGFGTVVAMSPEACHKIFLLCDRSHESMTLGFIKAAIGYSKNDSAYRLARSDAGQRFLALAASLGTLGAWNAALALHKLILKTAKNRGDVPTSQHLKQLMLALDNRLARAGFCDSVVGWAMIIAAEVAALGKDDEQQPLDNEVHGMATPPVNAVVGLTEALSRIARIGEGSAARVRILATAGQAAWFVAFIKWCMGVPPRIIFGQGRAFNDDSTSPVTVELIKSTGRAQEVRIETYDYADKLEELVKAASSLDRISGMVPISTFGRAMMRQRFGLPNDDRYFACQQALLPACNIVRQSLRVGKLTSGPDSKGPQWHLPGSTATIGQVFPAPDKIERTIREYQQLSDDEPVGNPPMDQGARVEDVPAVRQLKSAIRYTCPCRRCQGTSKVVGELCLFDRFLLDVSRCVAEIMALSLLNPVDPDGVMVYLGCDTGGTFMQLVHKVLRRAGQDAASVCTTSNILEHATKLLGHEKLDINTWVMSSYRDQTIYPRLLSTQVVQQDGILSIDCVPGHVMWETDHYNVVEVSSMYRYFDFSDDDSDEEPRIPSNRSRETQVVAGDHVQVSPEDKFPNHKVKWEISFKDEKVEVAVSVPKFTTSPGRNPRSFLDAASESIFINCIHDPASSFSPKHARILEALPLNPKLPWCDDGTSVRIVPCAKNEPMRFFCLASGVPAVIRMEACLECCVAHSQFVQDTGYILC